MLSFSHTFVNVSNGIGYLPISYLEYCCCDNPNSSASSNCEYFRFFLIFASFWRLSIIYPPPFPMNKFYNSIVVLDKHHYCC